MFLALITFRLRERNNEPELWPLTHSHWTWWCEPSLLKSVNNGNLNSSDFEIPSRAGNKLFTLFIAFIKNTLKAIVLFRFQRKWDGLILWFHRVPSTVHVHVVKLSLKKLMPTLLIWLLICCVPNWIFANDLDVIIICQTIFRALISRTANGCKQIVWQILSITSFTYEVCDRFLLCPVLLLTDFREKCSFSVQIVWCYEWVSFLICT